MPKKSKGKGKARATSSARHDIYEADQTVRGSGANSLDNVDVYEYELPRDYDRDEEIDEDEAFGSDEELQYDEILNTRRRTAASGDETEEEEDEDDNEDDPTLFMDLSDMLGGGGKALVASSKTNEPGPSKSTKVVPLTKSHKTDIVSDEDNSEEDNSEYSYEDDDDDEEDFEISDDEDGDAEEKLQALIKLVKASEPKKDSKRLENRNDVQTATNEVSQPLASASAVLKLSDLMNPLKGSNAISSDAKQILHKMEHSRSSQPLAKPLSKPAQQRAERSVAYDRAKDEVSQWQPLVKRNREASQLKFPLQQERHSNKSVTALTTSFKADDSGIEGEVQKVLESSGQIPGQGDKSIDLPDASRVKSKDDIEREKAVLAKAKALLTYYEAKRKRINKIKSKKYRKVQKKSEKKIQEKVLMEDVANMDPEAYQEYLEKLERQRAEERLTLRHSKSRKKDRVLKGAATHDTSIQDQLLERDRMRQELKKRINDEQEDEQEQDSEGADDDPASALEDIEASLGQDQLANYDGPLKNIIGMQFMQRAMEKQKEEALQSIKTLRQELGELPGDGDESNARMTFSTKGTGYFSNAGQAVREQETMEDKTLEAKKGEEPNPVESEVAKKKEPKVPEYEGAADSDNPWLVGNKEYASSEQQTTRSATAKQQSENVVIKAKQKAAKGAKKGQEMVRIDADAEVASAINAIHGDDMNSKAAANGTTNGGLKIGKDITQEKLVREAFAADEVTVMKEIEAEKEAEVEEAVGETPEFGGMMPGWGEWVGREVKPSKKLERARKRAKEQREEDIRNVKKSRKDAKLAGVIINERALDRKANQHRVRASDVPHEYAKDKAIFEQAMAQPLGREWNTEQSFKHRIQPAVQTAAGRIIEPLTVNKGVLREAEKIQQRRALQKGIASSASQRRALGARKKGAAEV
eukprot:Clim_evm89s109 gene=Clim_evmTU89s109